MARKNLKINKKFEWCLIPKFGILVLDESEMIRVIRAKGERDDSKS